MNVPLEIAREDGRPAQVESEHEMSRFARAALGMSVAVHLVAVTALYYGLPHVDLDWLEERERPESIRVDVVFFGSKDDPEVLRAYGTVSWDQERVGQGSGPKRGASPGDEAPKTTTTDAANKDSKTGTSDDGKALAPLPQKQAASAAKNDSINPAKQATAKPTPPEKIQDKSESSPKSDEQADKSTPKQPFKSAAPGEESRGAAPNQTAPGTPKPDDIVQGVKTSKEKEDKALAAKGEAKKVDPISGQQDTAPNAEAAATAAAAARARAAIEAARKAGGQPPGPVKPTHLASALPVLSDAQPDGIGKNTTPAPGAAPAETAAQGGKADSLPMASSPSSAALIQAAGAAPTEAAATQGAGASRAGSQLAQANPSGAPLPDRSGNVALRLMLQQMPGLESDVAAAIATPDKVTPLPPTPRRQMVVDAIRKAVDKGYAHAQYGLARRELLGQGVPRDPNHAAQLLERAARQGHANAQATLGYMAARGYGMKQDLAQARMWFTLAASKGNESAARAAALIEPQLSAQDLIRSRRMVTELSNLQGEAQAQPSAQGSAPKNAPLLDAVAKGDLSEVRTLIARGEDADGRDIEGKTALINAGWRGDPTMVGSLIEVGADPDVIDKAGRSAINWASSNGHAEVVQRLIKSGVEMDVPDDTGRTALIRATINGHADVVKALVAGGARIDAKDKSRQSAIDYAKKQGYEDIVRILTQAR